jgi:NADH-quinone oxidoreductase subunit C
MSEITNEYIAQKVKSQFGDDIIAASEPYGMLTLVVNPAKAIDVLSWFKNDQDIAAGFLTDVCGAHFPDIPNQEFCVIYHIHSFTKNIRIRIKAFIPASNPSIASATSLYASANWQERETYDFFGINFVGHPNLTRILNADEMDYFPLRKEFPLEDATRTDKEDKYFGR